MPDAAEDPDQKRLGTVLLVEDDEPTAELIETMLGEIGYHAIVRVATVDDALKALETFTPRLAVLDANLRGVPAHNVAMALRARDIPFIVSTGYDPARLPGSFQFAVALRKPYSRAQLAKALTAAKAHQ